MKTLFSLTKKKRKKEPSLTKGNWFIEKRFFKKDYRIMIFVDVAWQLAEKTKYRMNGRRIFPFFRERKLKTFIINLLCTDFHEIVHIKMQEWKIKSSVCKNNVCENSECWWCEYTNYNLHWFFVERGIKI